MNEQNTRNLAKKFPALYQYAGLSDEQRRLKHARDESEYRMQWGFQTGDGWCRLIEELSEEITSYAEQHGIVVFATQVKEKFAGLRFHFAIRNCGDEDHATIHAMVQIDGNL